MGAKPAATQGEPLLPIQEQAEGTERLELDEDKFPDDDVDFAPM
jgi:hypothetical protein